MSPLPQAGGYSSGSLLTPSPSPDDKKRRPPIWRTAGLLIADAACQTWSDLRATRRASFGVGALYIFFIGLTAASLSLLLAGTGTLANYDIECQPDGSFSTHARDFDWWAPKGFFEITVAFGDLNFTQVKSLDIAWQVVGFIIPSAAPASTLSSPACPAFSLTLVCGI
ncbi:hypothetical protein IMZ48_17215 [Candidatus Bathyarchaeota archaeon]|nr:hypothetical protein [Candidatus Bathyarchaeota archaeon]